MDFWKLELEVGLLYVKTIGTKHKYVLAKFEFSNLCIGRQW